MLEVICYILIEFMYTDFKMSTLHFTNPPAQPLQCNDNEKSKCCRFRRKSYIGGKNVII